MKYLPLLWSGLWRKPIRTVLTILSIAVAFLLFGVLQGVITGFEGARAKLSDTRLRVTNRANIIEGIPIAYKSQIDRVAGVGAVSYFTIFIGYYQDRKNGFSIAAVDVDSWLDAIPNFHVPEAQRAAMHTTRTGALVGAELMKRFDWHIGDRISLHSMMWANKDGTTEWPVDIVGIVNAGPDDDPQFGTELYFNYDYLDSSRTAKEGTVSQFVVTPDKGADPNGIAIAIDRLFANSNAETTTLNERAWFAANARNIGDVQRFVNWITGAVLFTLLFLAGNTMSQSVRDRLSELGVLKALGFANDKVWVLIVAEAVLLSAVAAVLGLVLATAVFPLIFKSLAGAPGSMPVRVYWIGLALALLLSVLSATLPAIRASRLTVVEALSER
jgi:putative ABC transport system permease protein